jgi:ABC-type nitrate/sulfonate/bicarbonate transport system substrate-binding protein
LRSTVILLLACLCVAGCSDRSASTSGTSPADAVAKRAAATLRFVDLVNLDMRDIPLLMAFDELEAHGYVIEKTYLGSGALITAVLARGDADVAMINNQTAWAAIIKGADIRTISQFTSPATLLAGNPSIKSCRDLDDRKVGVPTTSGLSPLLFRLYFTRRCPGTTPRLLVLPESGARAAALMSGAVDAAMMPGEELIKIQRQSSVPFHIVMTNAEEFPDVQIDGLHVRREWGLQHRELVLDLLRAQLRAHRLINESPQVLYEQAVKRLALDPDTAKAIADTHLRMGIWDPNAGLTPETVQGTIDFLVGEQAVPPGTSAAQVADFSYLDTVLREMGRREPERPRDRSKPPQ